MIFNDLMTPREVVDYLRINKVTLRRWVKKRKIKPLADQ